ncbi:hypothetical protein N2152v2_010166 [Parachlorella kessleri]
MDQLLSQDVIEDLLAASRNGTDGVAYVLEYRQPLITTVEACLGDLASPGTAVLSTAAGCSSLLLQALRVLRNACAGGPAAAEELVLRQGVVGFIGKLLFLVEAATLQLDWQLPLVGAQLLANAATASPACATAVWQATFPLQLNILGHINLGPLQSALSLCLLTCCRKVPGAAAALCSPAGSPIMAAVLFAQHQLQQGGKHNDNLGLLVSYLCFQRGLLPALALSLTGATSRAASDNPADGKAGTQRADSNGYGTAAALVSGAAMVAASPSLTHVVLLQELSHEAQAGLSLNMGNEDDKRAGSTACEASLLFLVSLAEELALQAKHGLMTEGQQQVLQDTLQLLRDLAGIDDSPVEPSSISQQPTCPVALLQKAGLLPLLLAMLKALGPIRSSQHPQQAAQGTASNGCGSSASGSAGSCSSGAVEPLPVAELAPALAGKAEELPAEPPYFGYRSDILSVLANAAYGRPSVKAELQALGGVELILTQCQMDRQSPLAREWALWGVRNLCEGNEAAQAAIRELQLCTALETEETRQLGVKLELDKSSGRLRVVQRQPQQA